MNAMNANRHPPISLRKQPRQARSNALVEVILEAAIQVLAKEGAQKFTTTRVAERAGVSVGSVYQYFPNKAAILFRLQTEEWRHTAHMLSEILLDRSQPVLARLRHLTCTFIQSECDEAAMRVALHDAAPLYRHAPEADKTRRASDRALRAFMQEALPDCAPVTRRRAGALILSTLGAVGESYSETAHTPREINAYANDLANMMCAYLRSLGAGEEEADSGAQ